MLPVANYGAGLGQVCRLPAFVCCHCGDLNAVCVILDLFYVDHLALVRVILLEPIQGAKQIW